MVLSVGHYYTVKATSGFMAELLTVILEYSTLLTDPVVPEFVLILGPFWLLSTTLSSKYAPVTLLSAADK